MPKIYIDSGAIQGQLKQTEPSGKKEEKGTVSCLKERSPLVRGNPYISKSKCTKKGIKTQDHIDFERLKDRLSPYILSLVERILPGGRLEGREFVALNPNRPDKNLKSFRINTQTGKWADFATNDKGGDIISLWAYVRNIKQIDAAKELIGIVGGE